MCAGNLILLLTLILSHLILSEISSQSIPRLTQAGTMLIVPRSSLLFLGNGKCASKSVQFLLVRRAKLELPRYSRAFSRSPTCYSKSIELRDYQQHVIDRCMESVTNGKKRIGVSLATGGGKTVIFANLIKQMAGTGLHRALVLVHRRELVMQAAETIKKFIPQARLEIEMGKYVCEDVRDCDIIVASVQSLIRRIDGYNPRDIDLVIVDEAHHAVANSYIRILEYFRDAPVVGFSATFERADHKALSTVLDEIIYHKGILEMINDKWLCESKFTTVKIDMDLSAVEVSSSNEDFKLDKLSKVMNTPEVNEIVLRTYLHKSAEENSGFKSTLLFAVDISHVHALYRLFRSHGINTECVTSRTKHRERDLIISNFKSGKIQVLINCGIFTEGTDMPAIDCILLCRPTRSRTLLVQMVGRGLRLHGSKKHCHVIDFVGASDVGVVSVPTLAGIENFQGELDGATLQDLELIKKDIVTLQKSQVETRLLEQESFKNWVKEKAAFDLTLTTFENFKSFHDQETRDPSSPSGGLRREETIFRTSRYPYVKFAKNGWALSLQDSHHLRVYKEGKEGDLKYILKLYREIPAYLRDHTAARFVPRELLQTENLLEVVGRVERVVEELAQSSAKEAIGKPAKNFTKFAKWRYDPATPRQKNAIKTKLVSKLAPQSDLAVEDILHYAKNLKKGEAANILFASNLAPAYPLKLLLKVLEYKKLL
ncbi:ZYBA0S03-02344g1_1 [Zygosaccharomyces bailii CLIB 213]|uniref:ZYBA0S03-02344g1_1 n=1 Tax=Zygosaccharomyces bailii (strain CLIB 213 / ATCC 58445 / CBS 680 / BCRC 21525 / NBRC 1098 / NCYC 1416 / NRRL Y-2227) TaxID=1333698 RepID=A0A8J2X9R1_ZYGB2|nr:ZYBA0S03-02344g1_1 [Zygosaccharomyces bailii CLIB 213]